MSALVWDSAEAREYESGLDRGVLYPPSAAAVPWNGLTSVVEKFDQSRKPIYWDGRKINDLIVLGDFEASMKAVTFPDAFSELEGVVQANPGMYLGNQKPKSFGLSYRTRIGNSIDDQLGYKIHILYNVIAMPKDRTFSTMTDAPSITEFEWDISAVPEEILGFRPTAHIIIDSTDTDPDLLVLLEGLLYGTDTTDPVLIPMAELLIYLLSWFSVVIVDNGDGTWTAYSSSPDLPIVDNGDGTFDISAVFGTFLDADTYEISSTP